MKHTYVAQPALLPEEEAAGEVNTQDKDSQTAENLDSEAGYGDKVEADQGEYLVTEDCLLLQTGQTHSRQ